MSIVIALLMALPIFAGELTTRQQELKNQIIEVARLNTSNVANRVQVRAEIDALILELSRSLPPITAQTWTKYAVGSWKQLWADEQNNSTPDIDRNFDRIYQYVSPTGLAVNLGQRTLPSGERVTFALKARGVVTVNVQNTKILEGFFKKTPLLSSMSIPFLANDILSNSYSIFTPIKLGEFPRGPVNAESNLTFSYLDEDLKIGTAPNVYTGANEMFILVRENIIP